MWQIVRFFEASELISQKKNHSKMTIGMLSFFLIPEEKNNSEFFRHLGGKLV
jgi:hypothetical protein